MVWLHIHLVICKWASPAQHKDQIRHSPLRATTFDRYGSVQDTSTLWAAPELHIARFRAPSCSGLDRGPEQLVGRVNNAYDVRETPSTGTGTYF